MQTDSAPPRPKGRLALLKLAALAVLHSLAFGGAFGVTGLVVNAVTALVFRHTDPDLSPADAFKLNNVVLIGLVILSATVFFTAAFVTVVLTRSSGTPGRYVLCSVLGMLVFAVSEIVGRLGGHLALVFFIPAPAASAVLAFLRSPTRVPSTRAG
jgi:hypothetical protein